MGVCASSKQPSKRNTQSKIDPTLSIQPPDTASFSNIALPTLNFKGLINNVKIKRCEYDYVSVTFKIGTAHQYSPPQKPVEKEGKVHWREDHIFSFDMDEYQLRKNFLIIQVYDRYKTVIGSIKINMYLVWTGPYHFDFAVAMPKSNQARLSFNFKLSQKIRIRISSRSTEFLPKEEQQSGDRFSYSMVTITGQETQQGSEKVSYTLTVRSNKNGVVQENNRDGSPQCLVWRKQLCDQEQMPTFDRSLPLYQLYSSSLHVIFWKTSANYGYHAPQIYAQCYISLLKMLKSDYIIQKDSSNNITFLRRQSTLEEKCWHRGQQVGKSILKFDSIVQTHEKQLQSCVRTECGVLTSSPVFTNPNQPTKTSDKGCTQIEQIRVLGQKISELFISYNNNKQNKNFIIARENISNINCHLQSINFILKRSNKESLLFFQYKNQLQLQKSQKFLIQLGFKIINCLHQDKVQIEENCWKILRILLRRGEFKLSFMGVKEKEQVSDLKIEVGLKYQELLNLLLQQTLNSLTYQGNQVQKEFAQSFCAYAYFRLPAFRQQILSVIKKDTDPQITEWRGTEFDLYSQRFIEDQDDFFQNLFDWDLKFHKMFTGNEKYMKINSQLQQILKEQRWKTRLGKRSGAFYKLLINWVDQIQYVAVVSKYVKWQCIPGYTTLLQAFLVQMKRVKISDYSEHFRKCAMKLLSNQKLLNVFVVILLKKTNANKAQSTYITFSFIEDFLKVLKANLRPIPGTFDYKFFVQGMKIVLQSQFQYAISQILIIIYNNFQLFGMVFIGEMLLYLLGKLCFKFFFHWSYNLRHIFMTLLYCKIQRWINGNGKMLQKQKQLDKNESGQYWSNVKIVIQQRYRTILQILHAEQRKKGKSNTTLDLFYDKDLYKKMRRKLPDIRRNHSHSKSSQFVDVPQSIMVSQSESPLNYASVVMRKLTYFQESDVAIAEFSTNERIYFDLAVREWQNLKQETEKSWKINPNYLPDLMVKKVMDQKESKPTQLIDW